MNATEHTPKTDFALIKRVLRACKSHFWAFRWGGGMRHHQECIDALEALERIENEIAIMGVDERAINERT